ncbi:MAG TPA: NB-ARC domain-containing protein, partial [Thermoanaerobaculia bacterium]
MSEILYRLASLPLAVVVMALLAAAVLIYLIVWALREGREISFWPPRIGARPHPLAVAEKAEYAPERGALTNLPGRSYARLLGRKKELQTIVELLADDNNRQIVAVCGLGGIGKTALALEAAEVCRDRKLFDDIVWVTAKDESFVGGEIRSHVRAAISVDSILRQIASLMGSDQIETARQALRTRRWLVVIDNIETIHDYKSFVGEVVELSPESSRFLLTSRPQFTDYSEIFTLVLNGLKETDGVALMRDEIENRGFARTVAPDEETLRRIFAVTGGAPLAMKLLIGQLGHLPVDEVIEDLQKMSSSSIEQMYAFI